MFKSHKFVSLLLILLFISFGLSISIGVIDISLRNFFDLSETEYQILSQLRIPRAITAVVAGSCLALAGVIMQVLLRNPLADPYILGVSGGGSVAAILSILLGLSGVWVIAGSFFGAGLSILILFFLVRKSLAKFSFWLILTGVVLAALWGAIIQFILLTSPNAQLKGMLFWLMGDLANTTIPWWALLVLIGGFVTSLVFAREMNILTTGFLPALNLGVAVNKVSWVLLIIAAALTATAVSIAGNIGFVGLIVPHIARMLGAVEHKVLIPSTTILGAILLLLADLLARTLFLPIELPVGILTTVVGVPVFIFLLIRGINVKPR